jgi:hypothetical protein
MQLLLIYFRVGIVHLKPWAIETGENISILPVTSRKLFRDRLLLRSNARIQSFVENFRGVSGAK